MCVIIYVPKVSTITVDEIKNAWNTNPDGAGYSIQKDGKVYFHRGFMDMQNYIDEILPLIGKYNLLLHFRISTSKAVNKVQTHPYKKGNVTLTQGTTQRPVICMNGIISGQKVYKDCNDTMSYIIDHEESFKVINQDLINIIEKASGAKWAVMTPDNVFLSSKFVKDNGKYYSNKNHLWRSSYKTIYNYNCNSGKKINTFENLIRKGLQKGIRKDTNLYEDVEDFIDLFCNDGYCNKCTKCLETAKTLRDVKIILKENYYNLVFQDDYLDDYEKNECCCALDDYFESWDTYDYNKSFSDFYDYDDYNCYDYDFDDDFDEDGCKYYIGGKRVSREEYFSR